MTGRPPGGAAVTPATEEVTVGGVALRYRLDGPPGAPVVALANSLGTSAAMWDAQVAALAPYRQVLRYEHRGHGGAAAPPGPYTVAGLAGDLVGLLDALGIAEVSLAGWSLGGMVAMAVAARHPDRVARLALCCTAAHLPPAEGWTERAEQVRAGGTAPLLDALLGRWFTDGFAARRPDVAGQVAAMLAAADPEGYAGCCEAIGAMDQRPELGAIRAPTLVLAGADDPVTPPAVALQVAGAIPDAGLTVLPGAAHLAALEQPAAVSAALVDHLVGRPAVRGEAARRGVLGDAHVDRSSAEAGFSEPFVEFITRYAWGEVWSRPGLDHPTRSAITLAVLTALGRWEELPLHVRGARRNGLSPDQIAEVLLHTAIYAGVPAANTAFATARRVLAEEGAAGQDTP